MAAVKCVCACVRVLCVFMWSSPEAGRTGRPEAIGLEAGLDAPSYVRRGCRSPLLLSHPGNVATLGDIAHRGKGRPSNAGLSLLHRGYPLRPMRVPVPPVPKKTFSHPHCERHQLRRLLFLGLSSLHPLSPPRFESPLPSPPSTSPPPSPPWSSSSSPSLPDPASAASEGSRLGNHPHRAMSTRSSPISLGTTRTPSARSASPCDRAPPGWLALLVSASTILIHVAKGCGLTAGRWRPWR